MEYGWRVVDIQQHARKLQMASTAVISFWKKHRQFWLPLTPAAKEEADAAICAAFWGEYPWQEESIAGQAIYLDQFSRHFQRAGRLPEEEVLAWRQRACALLQERVEDLCGLDEVELTFALMPFKHLEVWDFIFHIIHERWLPVRGVEGTEATLLEFPTLQRFYMDTYKKAYTLERVRAELYDAGATAVAPQKSYDAALICESYPELYLDADHWHLQALLYTIGDDPAFLTLKKHFIPLSNPRDVYVSLSGGVDSMVTLLIMKMAIEPMGSTVRAIHIIYGNRAESEDEAQFITEYCRRLAVPLTLYRIPWLRRGQVDRAFYEEMTRQLRFWTYQAAPRGSAEKEPEVILGHIQDDVVENIWTNLATGTHLDNLKMMRSSCRQMGVRLLRPLLRVEKSTILAAAKLFAVPYLKNTTPLWSNRGKFREHFHAATIKQFGAGVDAKMVAFADAMERQAAIIHWAVYRPMYESWCADTGEVNITPGVNALLDATGWGQLFDHLCHEKLRVNKPSAKAVAELDRRMRIPYTAPIRVNMSGTLHVIVRWEEVTRTWWMKCVVAEKEGA